MGRALLQPEEQSGVRAAARRFAGRGKGALRGTRAVVSVLIGDLVIPTSKKRPKSILWGFVLQINSWVGCTGRISIDEGHQHGQGAKWTVPPPMMKGRDWVVLTNLSSRVWRSYMPVQSACIFTLQNKPHGRERLSLRKSKQPLTITLLLQKWDLVVNVTEIQNGEDAIVMDTVLLRDYDWPQKATGGERQFTDVP